MLYDLCKLLDKKAVISIAKSCRYVKKKKKKEQVYYHERQTGCQTELEQLSPMICFMSKLKKTQRFALLDSLEVVN